MSRFQVGDSYGLKKQVDTITEEHSKLCVMLNALEAGQKLRDEEIAKLRQEIVDLRKQLEDVTGQRDRFKASWKKEFDKNLTRELYGLDENDWPLVPVDPSCIPAGHRAVEVSRNTKGNLISSSVGRARHCTWVSAFPRLLIEPIPAAQPDPLPVPEPPAWLRQGWWYAMDQDGKWAGFEARPNRNEVTMDWYGSPFVWIESDEVTPSMNVVPADRWAEACWQVK